ncbi:MAG: hypothetical protein WBL62_05810 [Gallionella sp.]
MQNFDFLSSKKAHFVVFDASAKLQQGESVIELNAPHMSFEMSVTYLTKSVKQAFTQQASSEHEAQEKIRRIGFKLLG